MAFRGATKTVLHSLRSSAAKLLSFSSFPRGEIFRHNGWKLSQLIPAKESVGILYYSDKRDKAWDYAMKKTVDRFLFSDMEESEPETTDSEESEERRQIYEEEKKKEEEERRKKEEEEEEERKRKAEEEERKRKEEEEERKMKGREKRKRRKEILDSKRKKKQN